MRASFGSILLAATMLGPAVQTASSQILLGTTGACNNATPGGPCTQTSTLVLLNARTGALIRTIGPVGYTVNGLAFDFTTFKLYASTAIGDARFHGLITINPLTGRGTPVDPNVRNFGLALGEGGTESPVHSISVDVFGHMVGWYDEFPSPPLSDTYVRINQRTGVATEFPATGVNTNSNGVGFGEFNLLWNVDSPKGAPPNQTQTAYLLNPFTGKPLLAQPLNPPVTAAIGAFHPYNHLYYGLQFTGFDPTGETHLVTVDVQTGTVTVLARTVDFLHSIAFIL